MTPARRLEEAARAWLECVRRQTLAPDDLGLFGLVYGADLGLAVQAEELVDADRVRDGVRRPAGELEIEQLTADPAEPGRVELAATVVFPAESADGPLAPGRLYGERRVELGALWFGAPDDTGLRLIDYTRDGLRASAMFCTHPQGEAAAGGVAAVPQAVTVERHRGGRLFVEISNALDVDLTLRIGRPDRPRGLLRRQPSVTAPEVGIPVPAGGSTHVAGLTRRSVLTEIELFAFTAAPEPAARRAVAALVLPIELPRHHPGQDGQWCA